MRETQSKSYHEIRDCIARDWYKYLKKIIPNAKWILLPSLEKDIERYIKDWDVNAFVLTGGEDLGKSSVRDVTEKTIFEFSQKNNLPILGVCRGCQAIYKWMGGKIIHQKKYNSINHISSRHKIEYNQNIVEVNSFHSNLLDSNIPSKLKVLARCIDDSSIECFEGKKILGIMWHPERDVKTQKFDSEAIINLFYNEQL